MRGKEQKREREGSIKRGERGGGGDFPSLTKPCRGCGVEKKG